MRAIDADFIIQKLTDFGAEKSELDRDLYLLGGVVAIVDNAPTIETVKHGYWIYTGEWNLPECSICRKVSHSALYGDEDAYCPCCGAKMGGTE